MKAVPDKTRGIWNQKRVDFFIQKRYKKVFKSKIGIRDIHKIWNDYIEEVVIKPLSVGSIVKIDKRSKIWVKATPTLENKRAVALFNKGLMYSGGRIVEANLNFDNSKYIYKVVYENTSFKGNGQLFFNADQKIKKAVNEGIKQGKLLTRFQCQ